MADMQRNQLLMLQINHSKITNKMSIPTEKRNIGTITTNKKNEKQRTKIITSRNKGCEKT